LIRISGDLIHLFSIIILMLKIYGTKNVKGLSLKTQLLYLLVFSCRYMDLFWNFTSVYNWCMKVLFISTTSTIVFWMRFKKPYCKYYDAKQDSFNVLYLVIPTAVLSLVWNEDYTPFEILWAFSIYLEAVAIVPQLDMVQKFAKESASGSVENLTAQYMFCLGLYRALYMGNWAYRFFTEWGTYWDPISWAAGTIQTVLYGDFIYYYIKAKIHGHQMALPV